MLCLSVLPNEVRYVVHTVTAAASALDEVALFRMLRGLAASLVKREANGAAWSPETVLGEEGLALDSIERLELAGRVNQLLHLHETGLEDYLLALSTLGEWAELVRRAWPDGPPRLTFTTSGTTGTPKPCTHAVDALQQEVDALAALFADRKRVVAFAPAHHIYGFLFTVLLPARLGVPVLDAEAMGPFEVARAIAPGDLVVTFPLRWSFLARSVPRWPEDVCGVTSTGPCEAALIRQLEARGLARMTEIYGSSETAGVGVRHDSDAPYQLFEHWHRTEDDPPRLVRRQPEGSLSDPVAPMDRLRWHGDRHFVPTGRVDDVVQVGGENVSPAAVAEGLRAHPGVAEAAVRLMRPDEGVRLKAFVVPTAAAEAAMLRQELPAWCRAHFEAPHRPAAFTFGGALPRSATGKLTDWS